MKILVTGATGHLGSKVVSSLLTNVPASNIVVSVRNPEKADDLRAKGVEVRQGDFDQPASLDSAFAGIDRILIVSADGDNETRIRQHINAVEAATRAKVGFIAYTSLAQADVSTNLMAPPHQATERAIRESGIPYAFLRNNWYLENELGTIQAVQAGAPWVTSAGAGKVGWLLRQDYAAAAAAVLTGEGHENKIYELSGPLLTQDELAAELSQVIGKEVQVQQVSDEAYAEGMKQAGLPEFLLPLVVGIQQSIREGSLAVDSNDLERVLGRPATSLQDALRQLIQP